MPDPVLEPHVAFVTEVVEFVNGYEWSRSNVVAEEGYADGLDSDRDTTARVFVFPGDIQTERLTRTTDAEFHTTWCVLAIHASDHSKTAIKPHVHFARELRRAVRRYDWTAGDLVSLVTGDIYDFEELNANNLFVQIFGIRWRRDE